MSHPRVAHEFLAAERPTAVFAKIAPKLGFFAGEGDRSDIAQNFRPLKIHAERSQIAEVRLPAGDPRSVPGQGLSGSRVSRQTALPGALGRFTNSCCLDIISGVLCSAHDSKRGS